MAEDGTVKKNRKLTSLLVKSKQQVTELENKADRFIKALSEASRVPEDLIREIYNNS